MERKENLFWPGRRPSRRRAHKKALAAWDAADAEARKALVVTHADCLDGVGAAAVALRSLGPDGVGVVHAHPDGVAEVLEHLSHRPGRGRRLLVTDLSLQGADFERIVAACHHLHDGGWRVEWRDHHHKQWEGLDLDLLRSVIDVLEVNADATECGCSLLQKAVAPGDDYATRLAACVRDRDLWRNRDPDSETLEFALAELGTAPFLAHLTGSRDGDPVVTAELAAAAARERAHQESVTTRILAGTRFFGAAPRRVAVVYGWLPKNTGLHDLLTRHGCAIAVNLRPNGRMSVRSRPEAPVCHLVAREFSGGGHPNASGGDLRLRRLRFWWYVLTRGRGAATERVAESCMRNLRTLDPPAPAPSEVSAPAEPAAAPRPRRKRPAPATKPAKKGARRKPAAKGAKKGARRGA